LLHWVHLPAARLSAAQITPRLLFGLFTGFLSACIISVARRSSEYGLL
jgi:hypothetical protein